MTALIALLFVLLNFLMTAYVHIGEKPLWLITFSYSMLIIVASISIYAMIPAIGAASMGFAIVGTIGIFVVLSILSAKLNPPTPNSGDLYPHDF